MESGDQDITYDVYCLNFNNDKRRKAMTKVFNKFGKSLNITWGEGVSLNDNRISTTIADPNKKRGWSTCYGHLDMISQFVKNSTKEQAIFCEDDILIRNDFVTQMNNIVEIFTKSKLDVLLLGYSCENKIDQYNNFPEKSVAKPNWFPFKILEYTVDNTVWGSQMYMLSKKQARVLLEKYYTDYAERTLYTYNMVPFSTDWTITKDGNRALVYPPIAIENNNSSYDDGGQLRGHNACFKFCYSKELFE
jgi:GR25 family glycosyltransferase involved in LPS biosynthesis